MSSPGGFTITAPKKGAKPVGDGPAEPDTPALHEYCRAQVERREGSDLFLAWCEART